MQQNVVTEDFFESLPRVPIVLNKVEMKILNDTQNYSTIYTGTESGQKSLYEQDILEDKFRIETANNTETADSLPIKSENTLSEASGNKIQELIPENKPNLAKKEDLLKVFYKYNAQTGHPLKEKYYPNNRNVFKPDLKTDKVINDFRDCNKGQMYFMRCQDNPKEFLEAVFVNNNENESVFDILNDSNIEVKRITIPTKNYIAKDTNTCYIYTDNTSETTNDYPTENFAAPFNYETPEGMRRYSVPYLLDFINSNNKDEKIIFNLNDYDKAVDIKITHENLEPKELALRMLLSIKENDIKIRMINEPKKLQELFMIINGVIINKNDTRLSELQKFKFKKPYNEIPQEKKKVVNDIISSIFEGMGIVGDVLRIIMMLGWSIITAS
jgi:hypothetical protein